MDNFRNNSNSVGYYSNQNQNSNNQNSNKNRNKKNRNKNNQNQMPLSPSKNNLNNFEYNSHSLDHQSFSNNSGNNNNRNFNNNFGNNKYNNQHNQNHQNNQNQRKFKNYNKRRNGSQGNYGYSNNENFDMINDRLNKSLTPNNSFVENSKISTSISLDNFDIVNALNQKRSPIMPNSYSFMSSNVVIPTTQTSPYKSTFNQKSQTIIEDDVIVEASGTFTPASCYSTPLNHVGDMSKLVDPAESPKKHHKEEEEEEKETEEKIKFEDKPTTEETTSSSSSSPDSKNSTQSQPLVTASEGESSFGLDPNIEVTITNVAIETTFANELEQVVASYATNMNEIKESESNSETSTASVEIESNKSEDGSSTTSSSSSSDSSTELSSESSSSSESSDNSEKLVEEEKTTEEETLKSVTEFINEVIEESVKKQQEMISIEPMIVEQPKQEEQVEQEQELPVQIEEVRPRLEEINLKDEEEQEKHQVPAVEKEEEEEKQEADYVMCERSNEINIVPVMEEEKPSATIDASNESIVFNKEATQSEIAALNESTNSIDLSKKSLAQKDPVVDCFSCSIL